MRKTRRQLTKKYDEIRPEYFVEMNTEGNITLHTLLKLQGMKLNLLCIICEGNVTLSSRNDTSFLHQSLFKGAGRCFLSLFNRKQKEYFTRTYTFI